MKKIIILILVTALIFACAGCSEKEEKFEIDYPDMYTAEYCYGNYVAADSNLVHLKSADNSIGKYRINASSYSYYGIKDVPIDKYLALAEGGLMRPAYQVSIVQKNTETDEPILDYKVNKAVLYWNCAPELEYSEVGEERFTEYGNLTYYTFIAELDCQAVVKEIREFLLSDAGGDVFSPTEVIEKEADHLKLCYHRLYLRLYFEEYENLVWESPVTYDEKRDSFYIIMGNEFLGKGHMSISDFISEETKNEIKKTMR